MEKISLFSTRQQCCYLYDRSFRSFCSNRWGFSGTNRPDFHLSFFKTATLKQIFPWPAEICPESKTIVVQIPEWGCVKNGWKVPFSTIGRRNCWKFWFSLFFSLFICEKNCPLNLNYLLIICDCMAIDNLRNHTRNQNILLMNVYTSMQTLQ